jgi:hypothetical protein
VRFFDSFLNVTSDLSQETEFTVRTLRSKHISELNHRCSRMRANICTLFPKHTW